MLTRGIARWFEMPVGLEIHASRGAGMNVHDPRVCHPPERDDSCRLEAEIVAAREFRLPKVRGAPDAGADADEKNARIASTDAIGLLG